VEKPESLLHIGFQTRPVRSRFLQQGEGSIDVRLNEICRSMNRAIDVALGREMNDGNRLISFEQFSDRRGVVDVSRTNVCRGSLLMLARFCRLPAYVSLSRFSTGVVADWIHRWTKLEPIKPAPPVTSM